MELSMLVTSVLLKVRKISLKFVTIGVVGLAMVYNRYLQGAYGYCPRALCDKQRVLPCGISDKLRQNRVKVYCPKCEELYIP